MRASRSDGSGSTSWNRKPAKPANSSRRADLLLDDRRGRSHLLLGPVAALLAQEGDEAVGVLVGRQRPEVDAVHPVELRVVERRRARADALEREALDQLVARHDRRLAVGRPAEEREEVHERLRDVARLAELVDRDRAVALRELLAVGAEHVRDVRVDGRLGAERAQHVDLLRRVRHVVVAADDVRDAVEPVLERRCEVVRRPPVGAHEDEILELGVRHLDPALDRVVPAGRALVGHADADRALVLVGRSLRDEPARLLLRALHHVELERRLPVPLDAEPAQRPLDLLDGLLDLAARVRVLDPQQALAAAPRAKSQLKRKVRTPPMWSRPVGDGAMRTRTDTASL